MREPILLSLTTAVAVAAAGTAGAAATTSAAAASAAVNAARTKPGTSAAEAAPASPAETESGGLLGEMIRLVRSELASREDRGHFDRYHFPIAQAAAAGDPEALRLLGEVVVHHPELTRHLIPRSRRAGLDDACEEESCGEAHGDDLESEEWVELEELEDLARDGDVGAAVALMEYQLEVGRDMVYFDAFAPRIGEALDHPEARRFAAFLREEHPDLYPVLGIDDLDLVEGKEREYRRWLDEAEE